MYQYNTSYNPYQAFQQPQQPQMRVIPVTSIDEARASVVDTANSIPSFFYNKAKNEIYIKQFDINTGNALFLTFEPSNTSATPQPTYADEIKSLHTKIDGLISLLDKKKKKGESDAE